MICLHIIKKRKKDILIIDAEGSNVIKYCIPASLTYSVIPVRGVVPVLLSWKFFFNVFVRIIKKERIGLSILCSIIEELETKVIISFIDNAARMGSLQDAFPSKLVISVQNGNRTIVDRFPSSVPLLYGFGYYEKHLLSHLKSKIKEYVPVGSLRFGVFMDKGYSKDLKKYDVCYISQFSNRVVLNMPDHPIMVAEKKSFHSVVKICQSEGYSLAVAMRCSSNCAHKPFELGYFHSIDKNKYAHYIDNNPFDNGKYSSYSLAYTSTLILSVMSTLAYEMFGAGKKVLFLGSGSRRLQAEGVAMKYSQLPDDVCIEFMDEDHIRDKMSNLISKDQNEYLSTISASQSYYMNYTNEFVHQIIKDRIRSFVDSGNDV